MKSLTKSIQAKFDAAETHVELSLPVAGILREVRSAFLGLCINAGKAVLAAMMESERTCCAGPKAYLIPRALPIEVGTPIRRWCWAVGA